MRPSKPPSYQNSRIVSRAYSRQHTPFNRRRPLRCSGQSFNAPGHHETLRTLPALSLAPMRFLENLTRARNPKPWSHTRATRPSIQPAVYGNSRLVVRSMSTNLSFNLPSEFAAPPLLAARPACFLIRLPRHACMQTATSQFRPVPVFTSARAAPARKLNVYTSHCLSCTI